MKTFFDQGEALGFVRKILRNAEEIRIATAFFELSGYALVADELEGKKWKLLLGNEEGSRDKVRHFFDDFIASLAGFAPDEKVRLLRRFRAILASGALAFRLGKPGKAEELRVAAIGHHAKLYIGDRTECLVTSANFTRTGLIKSREAGYVVGVKDEVLFYVNKFDEFFDAAEPLTEEFLEIVDELLNFRRPYDVHARALIELYGVSEVTETGPLPPLADFQRPVVAGVLQTIRDFGGAMLVASTGLGKTVMAAHIAALMRAENTIHRALIIAPAGLKEMWSRSLRAANVSSREFSYQILSLDDWKKYRMVQNLDEELRYVNAKTLLILDESHHVRNAYTSESEKTLRLRNERIRQAVVAGARVLLMTATPYSRGVSDINNQLSLLPMRHDAEFGEMVARSWQIEKPAELSEIAVASVLTAPTVVSRFSEKDRHGNRYIVFRDSERRFFPSSLRMHAVKFANPTNGVLKELLTSNLLRKRDILTGTPGLFSGLENFDEVTGRRDPLFESRLVHQFCSSVAEAIEVLGKLDHEGGYDKLRFSEQPALTRLAERLREELLPMRSETDPKYDYLKDIVGSRQGEKIVIFCIYRNTAAYLAERLRRDFPAVRTETTVTTDSDELEQVLGYFAPVANGLKSPEGDDAFTEKLAAHNIDILVATEAVSEGFNLQDAALLVNYDLPWTILSLAQRMGRILRPWHQPRIVEIWNFIPDTMDHAAFPVAQNWQKRLERRSDDYSSFARLPVLMKSEREEVQLYSVAEALAARGEREIDLDETLAFIESAEGIHTSSIFDDLAAIGAETAEKIKRIRPGFRSVMQKEEIADGGFFILLRLQSRHFCAFFSAAGKMLYSPENQMKILGLTRVPPDVEAPDAMEINLAEYEEMEQKCLRELAAYLGRKAADCEIVCSMRITPRTSA